MAVLAYPGAHLVVVEADLTPRIKSGGKLLTCSNTLSMRRRVPATRTYSASEVPSGTWVRSNVSSVGLAMERWTSSALWKPGAAPL